MTAVREPQSTYPCPDRSYYTPNFTKTEENEQLDIAWAEVTLSDGRPVRIECWAQDQLTCLTYFMSTAGLEEMQNGDFVALLEREGLLTYLTDYRSAGAEKFIDGSGNEMWTVNVVAGDDELSLVKDRVALHRYAR